MKYDYQKYPQVWGDFTPYVTGLDLVAYCGPTGITKVSSGVIPWQEFIVMQK